LKKPLLIIFLVLFIDQFIKIWIKTHMTLGQEYHIFGNWFIIHFTENEGMAFGMQFAGKYGKLILSVFRIIAIGAIGWYLYTLTKTKAAKLLIISFALIMAGAIGNLLDSAFYGLLFNESSYFQPASFMSADGGYAGFLYGKVVDMFYFPIIHGHFPGWFPFWGGEDFLFFRPVFNIADSSITIGVTLMFVYQFWFRKE
jgi:signal peptidase II